MNKMEIKIDIPDSFINGGDPSISISGESFYYVSPFLSHRGIQACNGIDKALLVKKLDKISDIIREIIREGILEKYYK